MIRTFVYASCTSCRKTDAAVATAGVEHASRDFFRHRFSRDELSSLLTEAGLSAREMLSTRSKVYKARQAEIGGLSNDALFDLMIEEPTLLRRPIVLGADEVIIGHDPGKLEAMIAAETATA